MKEVEKIVDWRGIKGLVCAEVLTDTAESMTFGKVFPLAALSKLSKTTELSSTTKYYNNKAALVLRGVGADEVSMDASGIQEADQAEIMGEYYDEVTGMYVEGEPETKYYAIGYITEDTAGNERYVWRLKGVFSYPETEHATKDDGTDSSGSTLTYTGINSNCEFTKTGKTAKAVVVLASKYTGGEDAFFAEVQTPDTVGA